MSSIGPGLIFGSYVGAPLLFAKKNGFLLKGVNFFIANLDNSFGLAYPENLSSIGFGLIFFWGLPPILPKILFWLGGGRGVKFFITNFYHLFVLANPENLSSTGLCLIFGGFLGCLPPFPPKIRAGGKFFITNLDFVWPWLNFWLI